MGIVTAHIVEEGPDVRVSFSGSILLDPTITSSASPSSQRSNVILSGTSLVGLNGQTITTSGLGQPWTTSLSQFVSPIPLVGSTTFGFNGVSLLYAESDITAGSVGDVSEITVDPSDSFFVLEGTTLSSVLGASLAAGDTLWTATNTNDTIVLSTSPPVLVPEPSSVILCFLAGIGLLRRKR